MGPDEYAFPVNNSAYTNAAAIIALSFATEAAGVLGEHPR
jgi:trehalose/maltose hydrolase-like predicted phosphorylase